MKTISKKAVKEILETIFFAFESPGHDPEATKGPSICNVVDELSPCFNLVEGDVPFGRLLDALGISFALGYAVGQILDQTEVDHVEISLIEDFLREKKTLYYFPHRRKAA